jgi:kynureninase
LRERFALPDGVIYLDGNSLGPPPKAAFAELEQAAREEWGEGPDPQLERRRLVHAHRLARRPHRPPDRRGAGETVVTDTTAPSTSTKVLHAALALRPGRSVILAEARQLPDRSLHRRRRRGVAAQAPVLRLAASHEPIESLIDDADAVVLINHVDYRTGVLRDMAALTARSGAGALVSGISATASARCRSSSTWPSVDFAVGCTYKYLNGGPGAPAFVVRRAASSRRLVQPLSAGGRMPSRSPWRASTGRRGHPPPAVRHPADPVAARAQGGARCLRRRRSGQLRAKSWRSPACSWICSSRSAASSACASSRRASQRRGSHVSVAFEHGYEVVQALIARGIIGDFRRPTSCASASPRSICSHRDVLDAAKALADILSSGAWREPRFAGRCLVT